MPLHPTDLGQWAAVKGYGTRDGSRAPSHIVTSDSRPLQTFWLLTIMNGASTIGRLTMATFSDRTGPLNMHIAAQLLSASLVLLLWSLASSTAAAIAFCVCFGISSGAVIGLPPASVANILANTYNTPQLKGLAHAKLGQWTGMIYSAAAIPALVGPLVAGHLVTKYKTYIAVQAWSGACLLVSALCMLGARWHLPCADGRLVGDRVAQVLGGRRAVVAGNEVEVEGKRASAVDSSESDAKCEAATVSRLAGEKEEEQRLGGGGGESGGGGGGGEVVRESDGDV